VTRRFLLLHGIENHRPPEHWQHWLADRLRERGEQVQYPQLPRPDAPVLSEWIDLLRAEVAMMGDGERVVLCHSLGSTLWLRAAATAGVSADRVLLVAPPSRRVAVLVAPSFGLPGPVDVEAAAEAASSYDLVCSDADPYNPEGEGPGIASAIGARLHVVAGAGHLAVDDGYGPWPAVEEWCVAPDSARFGT
jgi:predicted alpha/beta hydrolase family esterase